MAHYARHALSQDERKSSWMRATSTRHTPHRTPHHTPPSHAEHTAEPPPKTARQIELDINRTFPYNKELATTAGRDALRHLLRRYAVRNPAVGYVQGMGFIGAVLILHLDKADAFRAFCHVIENLYPPNFFSESLFGLRVELATFGELVSEKLPCLSAHFDASGVAPQLYATQWFMTLFSCVMPWETVVRVWDVILCDGIRAVHCIGIALLKIAEVSLLQCVDQQQMLYTLQLESTRCFDVGRLFALAFEADFIGSVPQTHLEELRAKHDAALVVEAASPLHSATEDREAAWGRIAESARRMLGDVGVWTTLEAHVLEDEQRDEESDGCSDESGGACRQAPWSSPDSFEILSVDDARVPPTVG